MPGSYFDVDGTLVRTNLVHPTLFYLLNQQSPLQSAEKFARALFRAPQMALAELRDRRHFNEVLFAAYEGMSQDRLLLLAEEVFRRVIKPALFQGARSLVNRSRARGDEIVLVSGALDFLMQPLGDYLGGATIIANRLEFRNGYATGHLVRPVVAGPEKAKLIREHARRNEHNLHDCFAYSDSHSDVPMLSVVGHPAAVNPDGRLARVAEAYQWPILHLDERRRKPFVEGRA